MECANLEHLVLGSTPSGLTKIRIQHPKVVVLVWVLNFDVSMKLRRDLEICLGIVAIDKGEFNIFDAR